MGLELSLPLDPFTSTPSSRGRARPRRPRMHGHIPSLPPPSSTDCSSPLIPSSRPPSPRRGKTHNSRRSSPSATSPMFTSTSTDAHTKANTLANRSSTPVARHVALARLAHRLSAMGRRRRQRVLEQLNMPVEILRQVRRYTPANSFGDEQVPIFGDEDAEEKNNEGKNDDDVELGWLSDEQIMSRASSSSCSSSTTTIGTASSGSEDDARVPRKKRKGVSFAKYAELRLFRD